MKLDDRSGLVDRARHLPSPNCDDRPPGQDVEVLVIHSISLPPGHYGGREIEDFFCNRLDCTSHPYFAGIRDLRVSAHFLVRRDGSLLQFVPVHRRAWHAGISTCLGREAVNDFSLGIELEGTDRDPFEAAQYQVLAELTRCLSTRWPALGPARVFGHADIAPGRKTDPGSGFDWQRYLALAWPDHD